MTHVITPTVGQIWKDREKPYPFFVRIESIDNSGNGWAIVQPVEFDGTTYKAKRHSKPREVLLSRFDGRSQGLSFFMEAPGLGRQPGARPSMRSMPRSPSSTP